MKHYKLISEREKKSLIKEVHAIRLQNMLIKAKYKIPFYDLTRKQFAKTIGIKFSKKMNQI